MKKWKRVIVSLIAVSVLVISVAGCGNSSEKVEEKTEEASTMDTEDTLENAEFINNEISAPKEEGDVSQAKIDYKTSELYTKEDMDACSALIIDEFKTWEGCVMYSLNYAGDEACKEGLEYIYDLGIEKQYRDCMIFKSDFHSPVDGGDAWEADYDYKDWEWYLGRSDDGEWELLMWGY